MDWVIKFSLAVGCLKSKLFLVTFGLESNFDLKSENKINLTNLKAIIKKTALSKN